MLKKFFLLPAILSLGLLLTVADFADAQRRGGSRGGGRSGSVSRGGGAYRGGGYGRGGYGRGYYGGGYYGGFYGPFGYGWGGYGPYWGRGYVNTYPDSSYYYDPAPAIVAPAPVVNNSASIRVIVPDPTARVWFDGALTQQTGNDRIFQTAALTPGYSYSYHIRATWMGATGVVTRERDVAVIPGQMTVVDLSR